MNEVLQVLCTGMFLALPPGLLFIRFTCRRPGWWLLLLLVAGIGWILVLGSFTFNQAHMLELVARNEAPPAGWDSDGAAGVTALLFGWLVALIYALPWLLVYALAAAIKRWRELA